MNQSTKTKISYEKLTIKPVTSKEMDLVADFIRSSAGWYEKFINPDDLGEHYVDREWMRKNYAIRDFYLGYNSNSDAIGTISLQDFGDYLYIGYLYLDVKFVGKGYGHNLMEFAREQATRLNKKGLILIGHPKAVWAKKAYLKFGFEIISSDKKEICSWNGNVLKDYYEEGFELYRLRV